MDYTPTNFEVADVFEQIAQLLERRGENPFKIRAYRNAVRTLENLPEPAAAINARGELKKINGFGDAIVGKTQEILATGTCELFERLKTEEADKEEAAFPTPTDDDAPPETLEPETLDADNAEIRSPW